MRRRGQKSYYDKHNLSRYVSKRNSKIKRFFRSFWRWILLVFVAVIVGYAIVTFGFQTVTVVGPSMNPTLADSQVVLVNKIVYKVSDVKRYDVIAYSRVDGDGYYDIKRVVGLPGETIRISNGSWKRVVTCGRFIIRKMSQRFIPSCLEREGPFLSRICVQTTIIMQGKVYSHIKVKRPSALSGRCWWDIPTAS